MIAAIIMFICSNFIDCLISSNLLSIFLQTSISIIIYFGVLFLLKDKMILEGLIILKEKFRKKDLN